MEHDDTRYFYPTSSWPTPGNKSDMERLREVDREEVSRLVELWGDGEGGPVQCLEVSAKENTNVDHTFMVLAEQLKVNFFFFLRDFIFKKTLFEKLQY